MSYFGVQTSQDLAFYIVHLSQAFSCPLQIRNLSSGDNVIYVTGYPNPPRWMHEDAGDGRTVDEAQAKQRGPDMLLPNGRGIAEAI